MSTRIAGAVLAMLLFGATSAQAQPLQSLFETANDHAFGDRPEEATRAYERLIDAGVADPDVEFNLATVHAQRGRYGAAIRHFERALRLAPGDEGARRGLDDARRVLADRRAAAEGEAEIDEGGGFGDALVRPFSEAQLAWAVLILEILLIVAVVARMRVSGSGAKLGTTLVAVLLTLLFVGSASALMIERGAFREGRDAIVLRDQVPIRNAPHPQGRELGEAREGDWARVLDRDEGFVHVRLSTREGWVEADAVGEI